jgi:hypothetical protein
MSKDSLKDFLPPDEYEKMIADNPYRPSKWWINTGHELFNERYILAWDRGKYYALRKLVEFMKTQGIPKAQMIEYFRDVLNDPNFHETDKKLQP